MEIEKDQRGHPCATNAKTTAAFVDRIRQLRINVVNNMILNNRGLKPNKTLQLAYFELKNKYFCVKLFFGERYVPVLRWNSVC